MWAKSPKQNLGAAFVNCINQNQKMSEYRSSYVKTEAIMKFSELYPDMKPVVDERNGIIKGTKYCACSWCGKPTKYIEINYESYFCSEECVAGLDRAVEAYNKLGCTSFKEQL